jgi:thiol-disulfide isomerase/thioredoxin
MKRVNLAVILGLLLFLIPSAFAQDGFTNLDGQKISLETERGKVVVLAVGASWLPLSEHQIKILNTLARRYSDKGVRFYFIATDSNNPKSRNFASDDQIRSFVLDNKLLARVLRDPDGNLVLKKYGINQIPSFILIGKDGKPVGEPISGLNDDTVATEKILTKLSQTIDQLLMN